MPHFTTLLTNDTIRFACEQVACVLFLASVFFVRPRRRVGRTGRSSTG
jgi:hypothetical protein